MDLLRWMGWMFARFVAVSVGILHAWMFVINLVELSYEGWTLAWIIFSGLVGAVGGVAYLLTLDGPARFRTRRLRVWGWVGMLAAVMLPTSLTLMLVPLVLALVPTLFMRPAPREDAVTSS
ncbi:MAG: hypothetical protein ACRDU9_08830 [Acidimicrobiia bacterium]